jgi:hypothetical protein
MHFNVDHVQTVLMRIEGNLLFLGTPEHALRKHAYHDDPTFTNPEPNIIRETYYDLTDAKVCKFSGKFHSIQLNKMSKYCTRKKDDCILYNSANDSHGLVVSVSGFALTGLGFESRFRSIGRTDGRADGQIGRWTTLNLTRDSNPRVIRSNPGTLTTWPCESLAFCTIYTSFYSSR